MALTASYFVGDPAVAGKPGDVDTAQRNPVGTRANDNLGNEFLYLAGAASVVAGSWIGIKGDLTIELMTHLHISPVAIATGAILAANWGWFQVYGLSVVPATMDADAGTAGKMWIDGTAGLADDDAVANDAIFGAHSTEAPSGGFAHVFLNYPWTGNGVYLT